MVRVGECQICGGNGEIRHVGGYFGAEACCDMCRIFFRNHVEREEIKSNPDCQRKCVMYPVEEKKEKFSRCAACRLAKCVEIGMSLQKGRVHRKKKQETPKQGTASGKKSRLSLKGSKSKKGSSSPKGASETTNSEEKQETGAEESSTEAQEPEPKVPCVASLHNLGNTCFLNSVVQVLRYTPAFKECLRSLAKQVKLTTRERCLIAQLDQPEENAEQKECESNDEIDYSSWDVIKHLDAVFHKMSRTEESFLNGSYYIGTRPYDLIDTIAELNPMFEGNQQQDAHEFMRCLLAYIQDASRSLNKYRKKAAESLGKEPTDEYLTEPKSLHSSPVKVEMRGGLKESPRKSGSPAEPKSSTRSSKRLSGGNQKRENCDIKLAKVATELKSPSGKPRTNRGRKSLTELQNHEFGGQRLILDCYTVKNSVDTEITGSGDHNSTVATDVKAEDGDQEEESRRLSSKRKASGQETAEVSSPKTEPDTDSEPKFVKLSASERRMAHKKRRFLSATQSGIVESAGSPAHGVVNTNYESSTSQVCSGVVSQEEDERIEMGQGDDLFITAQVITRPFGEKKQTARKSFGFPKVDQIDEVNQKGGELPVTKEAVVKLDKNGIAKYFQNVSTPQCLSDIERHLDPVADCIEDIFQGHVELQTRCCECEKVTSRREEYQDISVAVKQETPDETDGEDSDGEKKKDVKEENDAESCTQDKETFEIEEIDEKLGKSNDDSVKCEPATGTKDVPEEDTKGDFKVEVQEDEFAAIEEEVSISRSLKRDLDQSFEEKDTVKSEDEFAWVRDSLGEVERLQGDNKYYCDNCLHLTEAERSMHYTSVPKILTLHLKRFAMSQGAFGGFTKLTDHVPLPLVLPCIEDNCTEPEQHKLQLYGVITHTGFTLSCGHYTAYIRAPEHSIALLDPDIIKQANQNVSSQPTPPVAPPGDSDAADPNNNADDNNNCDAVTLEPNSEDIQYWFECDDEMITVVREDDLLAQLGPQSGSTTTPYLLFYQRV